MKFVISWAESGMLMTKAYLDFEGGSFLKNIHFR